MPRLHDRLSPSDAPTDDARAHLAGPSERPDHTHEHAGNHRAYLAWLAGGGLLGALTGLGGGVVIVPLLTLVFGVDIRYAIGASLVSVIATSSARRPLT